jgi:hypothetical protein
LSQMRMGATLLMIRRGRLGALVFIVYTPHIKTRKDGPSSR